MRFFADMHHGGAARAQVLLFQVRLGHEIYFGDTKFTDKINNDFELRDNIQKHSGRGDWLPCVPSWLIGMGGVPPTILEKDGSWKNLVSFDEFMDMDWDVFLTTRTETQKVFKELKRIHPHGDKVKMIALTGNDACSFEWDWIKNFMTSDESSYRLAPWDINKIHYSQELGMQYGETFMPIGVGELRTINCFTNCWPTFTNWSCNHDINLNMGRCPHCDNVPSEYPSPLSPYGVWEGAKKLLPDHTFNDYGIGCKIGCKPEVQLPVEYAKGALTVQFKTYEGYGFSLLQSIACGRPVIVFRRFHRYRTANKYLIPNLTCFEIEPNPMSLAHVVGYVTENLDRANKYAEACYKASKGLFNWEHEAFRVKEFLGRLI